MKKTLSALLLLLAFCTVFIFSSCDMISEVVGNLQGENSGEDITDKPGTDNPEQPGTDEPNKPGTDDPENPGTDDPENPGTDDPENPGTDDPENPGTDDPENPSTDDPENPGTDDPENPGTDDPEQPTEPTLVRIDINSPTTIEVDEGCDIPDLAELLTSLGVEITYVYSDNSTKTSPPTPEMISSNLDTGTPGYYILIIMVTADGVNSVYAVSVRVKAVPKEEITLSEKSSLLDNLWMRYSQIVGINEMPEEFSERLAELEARLAALTTKDEAAEWSREVDVFLDEVSAYLKELDEHRCDNGHTFNIYESNGDATCTSDGTMTAKCIYCDETDTKPETGSRLAHSYEAAVTPPSCTEDGYTTYTCSKCGESYVGDEDIPYTGHDFEDGFCKICGGEDPDYVPFDLETVRAQLIADFTNEKVNYVGKDGLLPTELEKTYEALLAQLEAAGSEEEIDAWLEDADVFYTELDKALGTCIDGHDIILDENNNYKPLCTGCGVTYTIISLVGDTPIKVDLNTNIESKADFLRENGLMLRYTYSDGSVRILPIEDTDITGSINTSKVGVIGILINKRTAVGYSRITVEIEVVDPNATPPDNPDLPGGDNPDSPEQNEPENKFEPVVYEKITLNKKYYFDSEVKTLESIVFKDETVAYLYKKNGDDVVCSYESYMIKDDVVIIENDGSLPLVFFLNYADMKAIFYTPTGSSRVYTTSATEETQFTLTLYSNDNFRDGYAYAKYKVKTGDEEVEYTLRVYCKLNDGALYFANVAYYILEDNTLTTTPPTPSAYLERVEVSGNVKFTVKKYTIIDSLEQFIKDNGVYLTYTYSDGTTSEGYVTKDMIMGSVDTFGLYPHRLLIYITVGDLTFHGYVEIEVVDTDASVDSIRDSVISEYQKRWCELENQYGATAILHHKENYFSLLNSIEDVKEMYELDEIAENISSIAFIIDFEMRDDSAPWDVHFSASNIYVNAGSTIDEIVEYVTKNVYVTVRGINLPVTRDMISMSDKVQNITSLEMGEQINFTLHYHFEHTTYNSSLSITGGVDLSDLTLIGRFTAADNHYMITHIDLYKEENVAVVYVKDYGVVMVTYREYNGAFVLDGDWLTDTAVFLNVDDLTCEFYRDRDASENIETVVVEGMSITFFGRYVGEGYYLCEVSVADIRFTHMAYYNKEECYFIFMGTRYSTI